MHLQKFLQLQSKPYCFLIGKYRECVIPSPKVAARVAERYLLIQMKCQCVSFKLKPFIGVSLPPFFRLFSDVALDNISPPAHLSGTVTSECLPLYFRHIVLILFGTELAASALQGESKNQAGWSSLLRQLSVELGIESSSLESQWSILPAVVSFALLEEGRGLHDLPEEKCSAGPLVKTQLFKPERQKWDASTCILAS